jgi:hypothetical protein
MIENIQAILQAVLKFIRVELKTRIGLFLERAVQSLRDRPYVSFSTNQQARAAERWLDENQSELETVLHQHIANSFTRSTTKKDVAIDELTLLDEDSLNVVMLRARLVSSVMEKARESVVALEVRLEALKQAGAQINSKAFTPGAIADGFMETLEQLAVPPEVQILLMETYSDRGTEMLVNFYTDLNELLIQHGVLPGFKYSMIKSSAGAAKTTPKAGEESDQADSGRSSGAGGSSGSAKANADNKGTGAGKAGMDMAPPWPAVSAGAAIPADFAQLLDAKLNAMQQALAHLTAETWQPGTLRDTFSLPPPIALSPDQEESIDHIEAVFLDLIRDTRISSRFRSELNRLILPLMSLRLSDAELFKDPENPVRRFIRQLALLGYRDAELPIREFEHISLIVGRIVSERAQELASFKSGADALYTIARNEVRLQLEARQKSRKRPVPATAPRNEAEETRVAESLHFTRKALRSMSAGLHLPTIAQHFVLRLLAPWMMVEYQRHGEDSDQMRDCILLASTFFDLLEPASDVAHHKRRKLMRQQTIEQMAFETLQSRTQEREAVILLEGMAAYFDELNADPKAGLVRSRDAGSESFVSYLDDLAVARAID